MRTIARTLCLLAALTPVAGRARADAGLLTSAEVTLSTVMQQHQSSFSGLGLRGKIRVPQLIEGFSVMPAIEYWRNQSTIQAFDITTVRKDATLAGVMRYDFKHEGFQPYVGLGLGAHFLSSEVDAPVLGLNDASDSLIKGGVLALGGISFGLAGKLGNVLELEYHHLPGQSQLKLNWGLSIGL